MYIYLCGGEVLFLKIIYLFVKNKYENCWIITERETEARDNGYEFFSYLKKNNIGTVNYYYAIKKKTRDNKKFSSKDKILNYGGLNHKLAYLGSIKLISTHYHTINPWSKCNLQEFNKIYFKNKPKKIIFLQHGITHNNTGMYLHKKNTGINLFISGAKREFEYIKNTLGYNSNEVVYTGLARFDKLNSQNFNRNILFMPTWRSYLYDIEEGEFEISKYFQNIKAILESPNLSKVLKEQNSNLMFFLHPGMKRYIHLFEKFNSINIKICRSERYDLSNLIINSSCLITDYSSVAFDFAYMRKSIIYFQFDYEDFFEKHYNRGYFDYKNDGFGEIIYESSQCINELINYIENSFENKNIFIKRCNKFFERHDNLNTKRIYESILNL